MSETGTQPRKELRKKFRPAASRKKNRYLAFQPLRPSVTVPTNPLFRYETNLFGDYAYKYAVPLAAAISYTSLLIHTLVTGERSVAWALISPIQLACLAILPPCLYLTMPLSHIIVCEEGMFVRNGFRRVFVPWKYIRSYHPSRQLSPWVIIISYYVAKHRYKRIYSITSVQTEHTMVEIMNFIRKVRQNADADSAAG